LSEGWIFAIARQTDGTTECQSLGDSKAMLCHDTEDLERYFKGTGVLFSITAVGAAILMPYLGKSGQCTIGLRSCSSLTKFAILDQVK